MNTFDIFLYSFNIVAGTLMTLIGFKIYKPFTPDKAEEFHIKYSTLFKIGGLALIFCGVVMLLVTLKIID